MSKLKILNSKLDHMCTIRLTLETHGIIKEIANRENRSISFIINEAIDHYLKNTKQHHGFFIKVD